MDSATYQAWRQRIWLARSRVALAPLRDELRALPPSRERATLIQMWGRQWGAQARKMPIPPSTVPRR